MSSSSASHFPVLTANVIVPASGTSVSIPGLSLGAMHLHGGPTAYANFSVDPAGDMTVDATGNDVNFHSSDAVRVLNTTASTTTVTGALIVSGGLGVATRINAGGAIYTSDATASSSIATGSGIFGGGVGIAGDLWVGGTIHGVTWVLPGTIIATDTTNATSAITGALQSRGGIAAASDAWVDGKATIGGTNTVTPLTLRYDAGNTCAFGVSSAGDLSIDASGNDVNIHSSDTVHVLNNTDASSSITGALQVVGGAGIARKLYVGSDLNVTGKFICPGESENVAVDLSGPWAAPVTSTVFFVKYGKIVTARFPGYIAAATVNTVINSSAGIIPVSFRPDTTAGLGEPILPLVVYDNGVAVIGSLAIHVAGNYTINVIPGINFQAAGLAGFADFSTSWICV